MDRMLEDERVPRYFHDDPGLREFIKDGRTSLRTDVFETPGPGRTTRVRPGLLALTRLHCQVRAEDRGSLSTQPHIKHPRERIIP